MEIDSPENMMRHIRFLKNEVERLKKSLRTTELQRKCLSSFPAEDFLCGDRHPPQLIKDVIDKWAGSCITHPGLVCFHRLTGYIMALSKEVEEEGLSKTAFEVHYTLFSLQVLLVNVCKVRNCARIISSSILCC